MELDILEIENVYRKRIALFMELLKCIERERDSLIIQDLKGLWSIMEEKQKILESLEATKEQLQEIAGKDLSYKDIPIKDRQSIIGMSQTILDLREEAKARIHENVSFIRETIDFFHEIISICTRTGLNEEPYGPGKKNRRESNLIYHSEV